MSRDISGSTISLSQSTPMSSRINANQSRIPIKAKRPILGERVDNYDHSTPRQHLVKPVKSVIIPRISSTKSKTNASPRKASHPTPPRATSHGFSPVSSIVSSPAGANVSRPGHTPHPRRSSVGLSFLIDKDMSMLADTSRPDFLVSDTDESEADEPGSRILARRGVRGPGRLMTPANSQESQSNSQGHTHKAPSPRRMAMRLPTPPASQSGTDIEETLTRTLVRPRPAPTPPRQSTTPSIRLNGSIAAITQEISPNPRRKKSPRVDEAGPSRLRSPFQLAPATAPATASPRHPRDRVEIVIGRSPRTATPSATPKASKGPRKARVFTKTPSASHPLSQSTGSQPSRSKKAPATAPQAHRRKSTPAASRRQSTPQTTNGKVKYAKTPRLSAPGRGRSRKSVTPAELKAMAGLLPEPVEQGSPSDDPLLLVPDDDAYLRKTPAVRPASHSGKSTGSRSAARIIDFDAAIAQGSARSSNAREIVTDYEVPLQGSEADHYDAPDWGFDSGGDSDNDDMGNDTFLHIAGARAKSGSDSLMARPAEEMEPIREATPAFSRSSSPFLSIPSTSQVDREQSPGPSIPAARPARAGTPRLLASPVIAADSPFSRVSAASPAREATPRKLASPVIAAASPVPSISGMPSPAAASHAVASPYSQRSRSATPTVPQLDPADHRSSPAPSPRYQEIVHRDSPAVSISRMSSPVTARSSTATPKLDAVALEELGSPAVECEDTTIRASPVMSGKLSVGMLSNHSSPMATKSPTATPLKADTTELHLSPLPTPRSSFQEALVDEEQIHDSWSSGSPLRLPSTPSALGLFMAEEADAMSTPFSHAPEPEADTPVYKLASPSLSTTPRSVVNEALPVVYTHSPRRSPICLPKQVAQENDVPSTVDEETEAEEEEEDKENQAPIPVQSTTPLLSPPTLKATPPIYPLSFSPRIASPLRSTYKQASPRKLASHSPIPPVETLHSRFADEEEECPSADVTLEGNSADWSLSDEGVDEAEREELSFNSDPESMADEEESLEESGKSALVDEQEDIDGDAESDDEESDSGSHRVEVALPHQTPQKLDESIAESIEEQVDNTADESVGSRDDDPLPQLEETLLPEEPLSKSKEQDDQDDSDRTDSEEGASSETLADDAGFESSRDHMAEKEVEEEPEHEHGHERLPAPEPRVVVQEKIVLKLISRGIVKVEPEDMAPASLAPNAATSVGLPDTESEERSTTPAYDPPQFTVMARSAKAATPARSMYPDLPATPTFAPLSPLPSTTPLGSPTRQSASPVRDTIRTSGQALAQADPSARPRSQLSRRLDSPEPIDEADKSIRLRSVRSLGDEFDDADADNSMRSVVEVSSLDPKAAARAAAILKLNHAYIEHGDISKLGESANPTSPRRRSMHSARLDKLDATRREDKTELLYEAELEIVSTRRSRSRSMSRFRGVSEAATELPLPGAWNGTPKRKRSALQYVQPSQPQPTTPTWGVSQWKKLEKVFRAEREIWVTERSVKAMPGGFIGWARMSTFGPPAAVARPWDPTRVVDRFLSEQAVKADEQVGDWSRELLYTRVEALERHAEQRKVKDQTKATEPSPKKAKTTPAAQSVAPPSTVRKLFGWVLPGSTPQTSSVKDRPTGPSREEKGKGKAGDEGQTFRDRLEAIQDRPMAQVISDSVSRPTTIPIAPPHPFSPAWKNAAGPPRLAISASTSDQTNQQSRPTPRTLSAILAESSSSTSSSYDRPRLHSSLSQRSSALDALFSGSTTMNTAAVRVPSIKKSTSVRDMVKSFEESGAIELSMSVKGGEGHKR